MFFKLAWFALAVSKPLPMVVQEPRVPTYQGCLQCLEICQSTWNQFAINCDANPTPECFEQQCLYAQRCAEDCQSLSCDVSVAPTCASNDTDNDSGSDQDQPNSPVYSTMTWNIPTPTYTVSSSIPSPTPSTRPRPKPQPITNPFEIGLCAEGLWTPTALTANPYPAILTKPVNITLEGYLEEAIQETSMIYIQTTIKETTFGYIVNLCDAVRSMGGNCPIQEGDQSLTLGAVLPPTVPAGLIRFKVEAINQDGVVIICFETQIQVSQ